MLNPPLCSSTHHYNFGGRHPDLVPRGGGKVVLAEDNVHCVLSEVRIGLLYQNLNGDLHFNNCILTILSIGFQSLLPIHYYLMQNVYLYCATNVLINTVNVEL